MFIVDKWVSGSTTVTDQFIAHNDGLWRALADTTTEPGTSASWVEITESNTLLLNNFISSFPDRVVEYLYKPSHVVINGELNIEKASDNEFSVYWHGDSPIVSAELRNYRDEYIRDLTPSPSQIDITLEEDGVYIVAMTMEDGNDNYAELYNFTSAEKCYLDLVINVFCACSTCNDCGGENYDRMINFLNTYTIIRDMVYVDRAVNLGLTASDIVRDDYLLAIGVLVDKLKLMTSECTCDNE
jgi:hypothetical protein